MGRLGFTEILLILAIALLLFGAGRISDIGKGLGEGIRNFKKGIKDDDDAPSPGPSPSPSPGAPRKMKKVVIEVPDDDDEVDPKQLSAKSEASAKLDDKTEKSVDAKI